MASIDADAQGAEDDVTACVCAVAVLFVDDTVRVPGVAIVVAKDHVHEPVTAPVRVIVWSPVFVPDKFVADTFQVTTVAQISAIFVDHALHTQNVATDTHELFFINTHADAVHAVKLSTVAEFMSGVVRSGLLANTREPEPVSSLITHFSCSEVVDAN